MSLDRYVHWNEKKPTREEVQHVLEDYLGGPETADVRQEQETWWTCGLPGKPTHPFARTPNAPQVTPEHQERWFEVTYDDDRLTITTRAADEFTNVVAEGFAKLCARFWQGRFETVA